MTMTVEKPLRYKTQSDVDVWIARLPTYELASDRDEQPPKVAVFDHVRPDSFTGHRECAAVLLRDIAPVRRVTQGRVSAQVLTANPDMSWPHPVWRRHTEGMRISLLVSGTAWFDIDGVGEVSFSANDSWCLVDGVDHALLEASSDFELLEIELRGPIRSEHGPTVSATADMYLLRGAYTYRPITQFGGTRKPDGGTSAALRAGAAAQGSSRGNSLVHVWDGCPWHLHDKGIQCGYVTAGSADIEAEGIGVIDAGPGTFWFQRV